MPTTLLLPFAPLVLLTLQDPPPSIYAPPSAVPMVDEAGAPLTWEEPGLELFVSVGYATDFFFRGIEILEPPGKEDATNLQFDAALGFDFGAAPHPFIALFVNGSENDPESTLQAIYPTIGFRWQLDLLRLTAGHHTFHYPEREELSTSEIFLEVAATGNPDGLDGEWSWQPFLSAAYDYDEYDGVYAEAGLRYVLDVGESGLRLTFEGAASYVDGQEQLFADDGFQHYRVGVVGRYELNELLNLSRRYGSLALEGRMFYTDGIEDQVRADTDLYGGAAMTLTY